MKRVSGRRLIDSKTYQSVGYIQKFDYSTQKLEITSSGEPVLYKVFYNLIDGPYVDQFKYKGTIGINNSSEFTVECKANFIINPEDRFFLEDESYGKVLNNRLVNQKSYNRKRRKRVSTKETWYEQIINAG